MKRILLSVTMMAISLAAISQTTTSDRQVVRQSFFLRDRWIDSVKNDTIGGIKDHARTILTAKAVEEYVSGEMKRPFVDSIRLEDTTGAIPKRFYIIKPETINGENMPDHDGYHEYDGLFISAFKNHRYDRYAYVGPHGVGAVGNYFNEIGGHPQIFSGDRQQVQWIYGIWGGGGVMHVAMSSSVQFNGNPDFDIDMFTMDSLNFNVLTGVTANNNVRRGSFITYGRDMYPEAREYIGLDKITKEHADSTYLKPTSLSATSPMEYNPATGVFSMPAATQLVAGYISLGNQTMGSGTKSFNGHVNPTNNNAVDLGNTSTRWRVAYLSNAVNSPNLIGGTGVASSLTFRTTTGNSTTGADFIWQSGNNGNVELARLLNNGNFGIGDATPSALLTVGNGDRFKVDNNGNITGINNVATSFPSTQGAAKSVYQNDGSGNFGWLIVNQAEYTPTVTEVTNVSASSPAVCQYLRIGDRVHVTGYVDFTLTTGNTMSEIDISLPVASNLAADTDVAGTATTSFTSFATLAGVQVSADTTYDRVKFDFRTSAGTDGQPGRIAFSFTYKII